MTEPIDLRVAVVDDEQLAREEVCFLLQQLDKIEIVAQAGNCLLYTSPSPRDS